MAGDKAIVGRKGRVDTIITGRGWAKDRWLNFWGTREKIKDKKGILAKVDTLWMGVVIIVIRRLGVANTAVVNARTSCCH